MAYTTENNYDGNGTTRLFSFTFPYLEDTDIKVSLNQVATTNFTLANATQIQFSADAGGETSTQESSGAPKSSVKIKVYRDTDISNLQSEFFSGSAVRAQDLNNDFNQTLYVSQETEKAVEGKWNNDTQTIDSTEAFVDSDSYVMTAKAIDDRIVANIAAPALADGKIWAGNGSGVGAQVTPSGDVTMANTGAFTIAGTSVETGMIAADAIDGTRLADNAVDSEHIATGAVDLEHMSSNSVDSDNIVNDSIVNADINSGAAIAHSKLANVTGGYLLVGNGSNVPTAVAVSGDVTMSNAGAVTIASAAVEHTMMADDAVDGDILAADAVTAAHIADDQIDSEHYVAASIDNEHLADHAVGADELAPNAVVNASVASGAAIEFTKLENLDSAKILVGNGSNKATEVAVSGDVTIANTGAVTIATGAVETGMLADDAVDADKLAANAVVNASVASGAAIDHAKLAAVSSGNVLVGNGSNQAASVAMSGDVAIAAGGATTIQANAVEIGMIGCEQTTISDSDSHIPTSGAVVDYVAAQIAPIGGLEVIADDESFPNTIPNAGVVISIADAAGLSVNSSGVSTNADTLDNSTVTINGFPTELRGGEGSNANPYVFQAGAGLMVKSTGSSQTYDYHQALIREADFVSLSDDINDFNNRYRISSGEPSGTDDEGDLYFDTGTNKMYVYDGSAWGEVTSTGDFKYLVLCVFNSGTGNAGVINGSVSKYDLRETSTSGSLASVTSAAQLMVSINGIVQKPNTGTAISSNDGFCMVDAHTIEFGDNIPASSEVFVVQSGSALTINTPGDDTVSQAKIQNGAVDTAQLAADAVDGTRIADNAIDSEHYAAGSIDNEHLADNAVDSDELAAGSVDIAHLATGTDGQIITWNASGVAVAVGPGTDGQVLTSTGAGSPPAFEDAGGGGITREVSNGSRNIAGPATAGDAIAAGGDDNTLYGYDAGTAITTGDKNIAIGSYAGDAITDGAGNIAIGYHALTAEDDEDYNIAIGVQALETQDGAGYNIAIGYQAGHDLDVGSNNIAIGRECMSKCNTIGARSNIGIGNKVCNYVEGYGNTAVGDLACGGSATTSGAANYNTAMGQYALDSITTGDNNTCIGVNAGDDINTGYDNVCIGHTAGNYIQSGFDNVYIGRDTTAGAEGDDGAVVVGANISSKGEYKAHIGGSSGAYNEQNYSTWTTTSDRRIKKNIVNNTTGLDKINQITVRNFEYKKFKKDDDGVYLKDSFKKDSDGNYEKDSDGKYIPENPNGKYIPETTDDEITWSEFNGGNTQSDSIIVKKTGTQVGVIAQELESVLPGLVKTDAKHGLKSVNTDNLVWYLVNAIKELSTKNDALEARIAALEAG